MADGLGEGQPYWLAGILDALGAAWESLSWEQKLGLMLLAGAIILLSGGTLGLAFEVGMGVATVFGAARGAAPAGDPGDRRGARAGRPGGDRGRGDPRRRGRAAPAPRGARAPGR